MCATLEASGLDHGPISVFERMRSMGLGGPLSGLPRSSVQTSVARLEPKKRPRSSYRRFSRLPAPNCCWQLPTWFISLVRGFCCCCPVNEVLLFGWDVGRELVGGARSGDGR